MRNMKTVAIIPAAGMGRRMGAEINKQYLLLAGRPILAHTIELFQNADFIDEIYPVIPLNEIDYCREQIVEKFGFTKVKRIIAGGKERQNSVFNALQQIDCNPDDVVVIHDGVRPLVPLAAVRRSIELALESEGAVVAVPAKDTIKVVNDGFIDSTPPRESLWLAQTPQSFRFGIIKNAHELAANDGFIGTDDSSLLERLDKTICLVEGDYRNIKITTPEDLILAEAFLAGS